MSLVGDQPKTTRLPSTRLFVGSLPYKYTEGELLSLFVPFGRVVALKIMHNPWGKSRGLGFVEFDNLNSSIDAKVKLHNFRIDDRSIIVDFAEPDPLSTPEGKERHFEAQARKSAKFHSSSHSQNQGGYPSTGSKSFIKSSSAKPQARTGKPVIKPVFGSTRQSVYDQRTHHSRIGAKFASRKKR